MKKKTTTTKNYKLILKIIEKTKNNLSKRIGFRCGFFLLVFLY